MTLSNSSSSSSSSSSSPFTDAELDYLSGQRLGRLATVAPDGAPQNNPVGFAYNAADRTIDIHGFNMGASRKFRNLRSNPMVALVVDDLASVQPWTVRGLEIRGVAEGLDGQTPPVAQMSSQVIRIHPRRIISWGINSDEPGMKARNVPVVVDGSDGVELGPDEGGDAGADPGGDHAA